MWFNVFYIILLFIIKEIVLKLLGKHWVHQTSENTKSIFPADFAGHGVLNKDPTVLLGETRPPPKVS